MAVGRRAGAQGGINDALVAALDRRPVSGEVERRHGAGQYSWDGCLSNASEEARGNQGEEVWPESGESGGYGRCTGDEGS